MTSREPDQAARCRGILFSLSLLFTASEAPGAASSRTAAAAFPAFAASCKLLQSCTQNHAHTSFLHTKRITRAHAHTTRTRTLIFNFKSQRHINRDLPRAAARYYE